MLELCIQHSQAQAKDYCFQIGAGMQKGVQWVGQVIDAGKLHIILETEFI
jgi:hypothetical protein